MDENYSLQRLLTLRKLTRSVTDLLRGQMKEYLVTVAPLLRPKTVLGEYIKSNVRDVVPAANVAFKELQTLYETIATAKPFMLTKELDSSIDILNTTIEITPMEYVHEATAENHMKAITVTSSLKYVVSYSGYAPAKLKELMADRYRTAEKVQEFILHVLALHVTLTRQPGLAQMFEALHFPLTTIKIPEFGELPITCVSSAISTLRPPDGVLIESTEFSGRDAFEEVINVEDIVKLRDPLKEQLIELAKAQGESL